MMSLDSRPEEKRIGHDPYFKSAPGTGHQPAPVGTEVLRPGGVFSPVLLLKEAAIIHNLAQMSSYCTTEGVLLAPHGKTTMSPELVRGQLSAGAWAITAATPSQVRIFREFGVPRILLANELVDPTGIAWIASDLAANPDHEFLCYVDSVLGVDLLGRTLVGLGQDVVLDVLVEVSCAGGRTGARSEAAAEEVAQAARRSPHLRTRGVAAYEGSLAADRSPASLQAVQDLCRYVEECATTLDSQGLFDGDEVILSVGGGAFFDVVVDCLSGISLPRSTPVIVIRPGSYISHDHGLYEHIAPFAQPDSTHSLRAGLELWGRVVSRPEPGLVLADFGRRDVGFDQGLPTVHRVRRFDGTGERNAQGFVVTALNDQHAYVTVPVEDTAAPGDWLGCGISHPCTSFDKWRQIPVVDEEYVVTDSVTTYF